MAYHFGQEIKKVIKRKGMTVSEFARRINKSRENAYDIFTRKSLDTDLLKVISQVLDHDFLARSLEKPRLGIGEVNEANPPYTKAEQELYLIREELLLLRKEIISLQHRVKTLETPRRKKS